MTTNLVPNDKGKVMVRTGYKTIKGYTCQLLEEVAYFEDKTEAIGPGNRCTPLDPNRRSVGLAYAEIAKLVKERFPEARVSATSVRRVAGRITAEETGYGQYTLPGRRPHGNMRK